MAHYSTDRPKGKDITATTCKDKAKDGATKKKKTRAKGGSTGEDKGITATKHKDKEKAQSKSGSKDRDASAKHKHKDNYPTEDNDGGSSGETNDIEKEKSKWEKLGLEGSAMTALEEKLQDVAVSDRGF